jgi:hypothetical protein
VRGRFSEVAHAEVHTQAPRIDFTPDLPVAYSGEVVRWRDAQAVIDSFPRGPASTIQAEIRVLARDGAGTLAGLSEWRTIYLEPEYR